FLSCILPIISFRLPSLLFVSHRFFSSSHHFFSSLITPFCFPSLFFIISLLLPFIFYYFPLLHCYLIFLL
ncbi:hypothetical protein C1646_714386, partial [Rhizophagus diaphanus]